MQKEKGYTANNVTLLESGALEGRALSDLAGLNDLSLRNSIGLMRYEQAHKLVVLINHWRRQRQAAPLADDYAAIRCARTPVASPFPPAA